MSDFRKLSQDVASAPLGDLIASVGRGVAEAQAALDAGSLEQTLQLYDQSDDVQQVLRDTGYRPTFYTIPETEGELKLALTITGREAVRPAEPKTAVATTATFAPSVSAFASRNLSKTARLYAAPVDGKYQNSYNFTSQVSATVKFKIVAVPPSSAAEAARVVPDITDQTVESAEALLQSFDLVLDPGEASALSQITEQSPAAGALVSQGAVVRVVTFNDSS